MMEIVDDDDDEGRCELMVDLGCYCRNRATRIVREPYTPASFEQRVCAEHAASQIDFGYLDGGPIAEGEA